MEDTRVMTVMKQVEENEISISKVCPTYATKGHDTMKDNDHDVYCERRERFSKDFVSKVLLKHSKPKMIQKLKSKVMNPIHNKYMSQQMR